MLGAGRRANSTARIIAARMRASSSCSPCSSWSPELSQAQQLVDALSESGTCDAPNLTPPEPAMSAEGAKRRQRPGFGPTPDNFRRYPEDIGHASCREYVAFVVLRLADKHRCRLRFALPLRTRFALALRTRSPLRCWCRRDALMEGVTNFG
jgi:hypothetical protein